MAVGASGKTYDQLALPVRRRLLFAGEHTCKEHPDTVGGAMLTGLREAAIMLRPLTLEACKLEQYCSGVFGNEAILTCPLRDTCAMQISCCQI